MNPFKYHQEVTWFEDGTVRIVSTKGEVEDIIWLDQEDAKFVDEMRVKSGNNLMKKYKSQ